MPYIDRINTEGITYNIQDSRNLYNLLYPVGSVYISSTNSNPSAQFGGTWELIHKEFKCRVLSTTESSQIFTMNTTNITSVDAISVEWHPTYIDVTGQFLNKINYATTTAYTLFTFNPEDIGISSSASYETMTEGQVRYTSPVAGSMHIRSMPSEGKIWLYGCTDSPGSANANRKIRFTLLYRVHEQDRLDSFCDKFYWKRTA